MSAEQLAYMKNLACVLHSSIFGMLYQIRQEKGLFPSLEFAMKGMNTIIRGYYRHLEEKPVAQVLSDFEKTGIYQNLDLTQEKDHYFFKVGKCLFAGGEQGVHKNIRKIDLTCPLALFVATRLAKQNPSKKMYVYPSTFEEEGNTTEMELLSPEEYERKMQTLTELARREETMKSMHA